MDESLFDAVVLGTGLVESILAAALSKAGYRVAHLDSNPYYGGDEASLSLDEFVQWADKNSSINLPNSRFHSVTRSPSVPSQSRQYSICLRPTIIPSIGPMISALVDSTVAKYSGFRLLDCVSVYSSPGRVRNVPGSKEDIFKNKDISLIEKRRLMRFLMFASGDFEGKKELEGKEDIPFVQFLQTVFSVSEDMASVINYALGFCALPTEPTLPTMHRLRAYLRSVGRYGPSPFLIGHYGGIGDIAQGFCRASAVSGGVYILGRQIISITQPGEQDGSSADAGAMPQPTHKFRLHLDDFPDPISCNLIISSSSYIPPNLSEEVTQLAIPTQNPRPLATDIARCVAIIDKAPMLKISDPNPTTEGERDVTDEAPFTFAGPDLQPVDTAVLIFPPHTISNGSSSTSATALIAGEGSLSTPKGKWLIYLALPLPASTTSSSGSPQTLLEPYLDALLSLTDSAIDDPITPLFTTFYMEKQFSPQPAEAALVGFVKSYLVPPVLQSLSLPDLADEAARIAENVFGEAIKVLHPPDHLPGDDNASGDIPFWPPLEIDNADDDEW